jgi:hypothetical protein
MKPATSTQKHSTFKNESMGKVSASQAASSASMKHGNFTNLMEKFNGMAKTADVNTNEISKAFTKGEEFEKVDIQQMTTEGQKVVDNFMDKSMKYSPEAILNSIKEFYFHIKNDTDLFKNVKS